MAKEKWTDWISHAPGQEVPSGFEIEVEYLDRNNVKSKARGVTGLRTKGHPCWKAADQYGSVKMITRYRLRIIEAKDA